MTIAVERLPVVSDWTVVVPIALLFFSACGVRAFGPESVQRRTALNGATAGPVREMDRTPFGVRFSWDVRPRSSWVQYRAQVLEEFRPQFSVIVSDASSLVMSRRDRGDVYRLEFRLTSTEGGEVRVVFSASSN